LANNNARGEIRLLPPGRVPLAPAQYAEAVALLAELLLDAAAKRRGLRSAGVIDGGSGGVIGGVTQFPKEPWKRRGAA
jgi:hypothetical protein